ncbi:MAG: ABC transporter permease [Drouetiella hepatica Uher 2000/2452]|uniref:ABC transporter permease n=1 Tax=Drouetiella hepatica Uher 2000/2452 TaxID=904376 RepID=A0A951ULT1_9CYAN|nr:ABC transporter permease [Drouetiella hepatica Uher 2000/2452]
MNLTRILVVASNVFREVIRDRVLYLIGFFAIALIGASVLLPEVSGGSGDKIILDLGLAAISLLGLAIAIFIGTGLISKEIEKRTVYVMIAKPISRAEFIMGKHWGLSAVLVVLVSAMMVIYLGVLTFRQVAYPLDSLLWAALFQILELSLIAAVALLFGVFTNSLLAMLLTVAVYLTGHFSRDLLSLGKLAKDASLQTITETLYLILPDLARLDLKNQAVYGMSLLPSPLELVENFAYGVIYIALLLAIATFIFSRRQF